MTMTFDSQKFSEYFSIREFECRCGSPRCETRGRTHLIVKPTLLGALDALRGYYGSPVYISSGLRCKYHEIEIKKKVPGAHAYGFAADLLRPADPRADMEFMHLIFSMRSRFVGIGLYRDQRIVHVDVHHPVRNRPIFWVS